MALTHQPSRILRQLLIDLSLGYSSVTVDWACFRDSEPDSPRNLISVEDVDGRDLNRIMSMTSSPRDQYHGFKLHFRSENKDAGWLKAEAVRTALLAVSRSSVTISSSTYLVRTVVNLGSVLSLGTGPDTGQLFRHSLNGMLDLLQQS